MKVLRHKQVAGDDVERIESIEQLKGLVAKLTQSHQHLGDSVPDDEKNVAKYFATFLEDLQVKESNAS